MIALSKSADSQLFALHAHNGPITGEPCHVEEKCTSSIGVTVDKFLCRVLCEKAFDQNFFIVMPPGVF